jgi:hypothetical protein
VTVARIKHIEELPAWFNLEKYQETERFSAADWYKQLRIRKEILTEIKITTTSKNRNKIKEEQTPLALQELRKNPITSDLNNNYWSAIEINADLASPVRELTFCDLAYQSLQDLDDSESGIKDKFESDRWKLISQTCQDYFPYELDKLPLPNMIGDGAQYSLAILIDMSASNKVLREAFDAWLTSARVVLPEIASRKDTLYERWSRYGLLPYLDLLIWEAETENKITDRVMAQAITHFDRGDENLRKTLDVLATRLMRDLSGLRAVAALEKITSPSNQLPPQS